MRTKRGLRLGAAALWRLLPTFTHFTLMPGHTNFFMSSRALQSPQVMGQPISKSSLST